MDLTHRQHNFISIPKPVTLATVFILSIIVAFVVAYHTKFLPLFILLGTGIYLFRLSYLPILPFVFVAFISSDHIIQFRIPTPWGLLHPSIILIPLAIILTFFHKYLIKSHSFIFPKPVLITFIIFSLSLGVTVLLNGTDLDALMWLAILILGSGAVYFISANHSNHKIDGMVILKIVSTVATVISILAIIEYLSGYNPFCALHDSNEYRLIEPLNGSHVDHVFRARATLEHPLVLSAFLVFVLPVSLYFAFQHENMLFWIASTIIQYLGIFVTFSRSAYLLGALLLLIYLIRFKAVSIGHLFSLAGLLAFFVLIGYVLLYKNEMAGEFLERISFQTGKISFLFRIQALSLASDFISQNPYFGVGVRRLPVLIAKALPWYPLTTFDNTFFDLFCELGIFGLSSYLVFIFSPILSFIKTKDKQFGLFLPLLVFVTMIYFSLIFTVVYHQIIWITYWTLQGLFLMIRTTSPNEG